MLTGMPGTTPRKKSKPFRIGWLFLAFVLILLLLSGLIWLKLNESKPREAPEAERVLSAQTGMPFQVLIPAYMPKLFIRKEAEIITDKPGPNGEKMIQIIYSTRKGDTLTLSEWTPSNQGAAKVLSNIMNCLCVCVSEQQCRMLGMELNKDSVRVRIEFSAPNLLFYEEIQFMLDTLGPATNSQVFSSLEDVPLSFSVPPPVEVPVGTNGVQELTLVVSPTGYTPVHFSVKKDVPVRLIFRQLGYVGCGNELIFPWGARESETIILASEADKQTLEFTPNEAGEFQFHCPHFIYRGVMTVTE